MGGDNELRPDRHDGTQQGAFLCDTRRRSGTSSCLPTKAIDSAASDWCGLPVGGHPPMRELVSVGSRRSAQRVVSRDERTALTQTIYQNVTRPSTTFYYARTA